MKKRLSFICFLIFIGVLQGCASVPRMPEKDFLTAQPLDALGVVTAPVGIGKLDPVMPAGTKVGEVYGAFGKAKAVLRSGIETRGTYRKVFYEELRNAGYDTAGNETIFEPRDLSRARILIGGDIVDAKVNVFAESASAETVEYAITIVWRVFDRQSQREVFETQTRGAANAEDFTRAELGAFRAAFRNFLAQSELVDTLKQF